MTAADVQLIAHDALSALINLTNSAIVTNRLADIEGFLAFLVRMIIVRLAATMEDCTYVV